MHNNQKEHGFVLVTSLVILMILTIMMVGLYFSGQVNQKTSVSDRDATKGFYLAEAGLNYIVWALYADPANAALNNAASLDGDGVADNIEIQTTPDQVASNTLGYFDINNTINYNPAAPVTATLSTLAIPAHVALNISTNPTTNAVNASPVTWVNGTEVPSGDGAVVWLVPATLDATGAAPMSERDNTSTNSSYAVYAYSIAYVNGKRLKMLRAKIGTVGNGFPANLGSMTDGFQ